jgi:hypothetical protein
MQSQAFFDFFVKKSYLKGYETSKLTGKQDALKLLQEGTTIML